MRKLSITANTIPYSFSLFRNEKISSLIEKLRLRINDMTSYAMLNIPNYDTITEIPAGHLPDDLNTKNAISWNSAFANCKNLTSFPTPFYNMNNATNISLMFFECRNIKDLSMVKFGNKVSGLMSWTFGNCVNLIVPPTIPYGITNMHGAFNRCTSLKDAPNIPNSVVSMQQTFQGCYNLVNVPKIPDSVIEISYAFNQCYNLKDAPILSSNTNTMYYTFNNCRNLVNAPFIPNTTMYLQGAFQNCVNLVNAPVFDKDCTCSLLYCFKNCTNLKNIQDLPNGIRNLESTFSGCTNLENPPKISNIIGHMGYTFYNCISLKKAPSIGIDALSNYNNEDSTSNMSHTFYNCTNLSGDIYIYAARVTNATNCFANCTNYSKNIYVIENTPTYNSFYTAMGNSTYNSNWNTNLIPMAGLYNYAFANIPNYNTITEIPAGHLPDDINDYAKNAITAEKMFNDCRNLTALPNPFYNLNNVITAVNMFRGCYNIKDFSMVNFSSNTTNLCYAFRYCNSLVNAPVIPNGVSDMYYTFSSCKNLVDAPVIPNSVTNMIGTFSYCNKLKNAPIIPNTITNLDHTFSGCESLVNAPNIPDSVISMTNTFYSCNLVNTPTIPNNITKLYSTFSHCSSLKNISTIPNNIIKLCDTFSYCYNLVNAPVIPNSVTNMCQTFYYCINLVNAPVIPNSVIDISYTFTNCRKLVNAPVIPNSVTDMNRTFSGCSNLVNAPVIPNSVTNMNYTFYNCTNLQGDVYIYSNNVSVATNCFSCYEITLKTKNIYVYKNTETYNVFYNAMGNNTYNSIWNANLKYIGSKITFTNNINNTIVVIDKDSYVLTDTNSTIDLAEGFNEIKCYNKYYGKTIIGTNVGLNNNKTIPINFNISNTSVLTYGLSNNYNIDIINSIKIYYDGIVFDISKDILDSDQKDIIRVPNGSIVTINVKFNGYKNITKQIIVNNDTEFIIDNLEETVLKEIVLTTPFEDNSNYLANLVDDYNFEIGEECIQSGSKTYGLRDGYSYGYIKFITPNNVDDMMLSVTCRTDTGSGWNYAAVYVGTNIYEPTLDQIESKITDGNGQYLCTVNGRTEYTTYNLDTSLLVPNEEYYINIMYAKCTDWSDSGYEERFFIKEIKFNTLE